MLLTNNNFFGMQLKKEGRRNEYERHKLLALNQRQKMVSILSSSMSLCCLSFFSNCFSEETLDVHSSCDIQKINMSLNATILLHEMDMCN